MEKANICRIRPSLPSHHLVIIRALRPFGNCSPDPSSLAGLPHCAVARAGYRCLMMRAHLAAASYSVVHYQEKTLLLLTRKTLISISCFHTFSSSLASVVFNITVITCSQKEHY
ncbi:hypothetical protein E2C01_076429 [Portunus trituberculatus]|uniref:Uncharacterized protein n=1 Tax=Portunus trituberculatus TaxID=210409 RepID=A0A5B7IHS2_PORTR|nr:hypothetical protein [Portunus trituberculatus]